MNSSVSAASSFELLIFIRISVGGHRFIIMYDTADDFIYVFGRSKVRRLTKKPDSFFFSERNLDVAQCSRTPI